MHSVSKQRFYIWNIMSLDTSQMYNLCTETKCILLDIILQLLIPVAAWSKAQVCSRTPAENVGMNPTRSMDFCLLWVLCVSLRQADHSSRGVPLTVVCCCVWNRNLKNKESMACSALQHHKEKKLYYSLSINAGYEYY